MPAPKGNKNAAGKRVEGGQERIAVQISISRASGFRPLIDEYLADQGIEPTEENIKQHARDWFYANYAAWLKRQVEMNESAIIL